MIARSLATQADVRLLDEPTANWDIAHALNVSWLVVPYLYGAVDTWKNCWICGSSIAPISG